MSALQIKKIAIFTLFSVIFCFYILLSCSRSGFPQGLYTSVLKRTESLYKDVHFTCQRQMRSAKVRGDEAVRSFTDARERVHGKDE
jgi:hypothetical protein